MNNDSVYLEKFDYYRRNLFPYLKKKFNFDKDLDVESARQVIDEIHTADFERMKYDFTVTEEEWVDMYRYWQDYFYTYKFGNDTVVRLGT